LSSGIFSKLAGQGTFVVMPSCDPSFCARTAIFEFCRRGPWCALLIYICGKLPVMSLGYVQNCFAFQVCVSI